ncbi:MAG TPA: manganese efflux pump [Candidatus Solibacter sp.]|nr:manganese efflux pump [Candidatus Solibacter sp.]
MKLLLLVVPLGLDTFAVAAALGVAGLQPHQRLRVSAIFTAFEGGMPVAGLIVGRLASTAIGHYADFAAAVVLIGLGVFMLVSRDDDDQAGVELLSRTRGLAVLGLGLSISLDELAIGFTLGLVRAPLLLALALIAGQAFAVAQLGLTVGSRIGGRAREGAERLAGGALVVLGIGLAIARLTGVSI